MWTSTGTSLQPGVEIRKVSTDCSPAKTRPTCLCKSLPLLPRLLHVDHLHPPLPLLASTIPSTLLPTAPLFTSPPTAFTPPAGRAHRGHHAPLLPHCGHRLEALGADVEHAAVGGEEGRPCTCFTTTQVHPWARELPVNFLRISYFAQNFQLFLALLQNRHILIQR